MGELLSNIFVFFLGLTFMYFLLYQAAAVADPTKNLGGPRSRVAIYVAAAMPFFPSLVKYFPAILGCSDCV